MDENRIDDAVAAGDRAASATAHAADQIEAVEGLHGIIPLALMHPRLQELAQQHYPQAASAGQVTVGEFEHLHKHWLHEMFEKEHKRIEGESSDPEDAKHPDLPDIGADFGYKATTGERIADEVARFGGSWKFIIIFSIILFVWMFLNAVILAKHAFDPFPFILLNLCLSTLATLQAPVIMMSQNRQEQRDHLRSEYDFQTNLRAEISLRSLHNKYDRMLSHQWERLEQLHEMHSHLHKLLEAKNGVAAQPARQGESSGKPAAGSD